MHNPQIKATSNAPTTRPTLIIIFSRSSFVRLAYQFLIFLNIFLSSLSFLVTILYHTFGYLSRVNEKFICKQIVNAGAGREDSGPLGEPREHFARFVAEADFFLSAVLGAVRGYRSEGFHEFGVLGSVHHIGRSVVCSVDVSGACVSIEVALEVFALADRSACALDLVVEAVGAEVIAEVIGLADFARKGEADGLFGVLPVVAVVVKVVKTEGSHCGSPLFLSVYIIARANRFVKYFFKIVSIFFRLDRAPRPIYAPAPDLRAR